MHAPDINRHRCAIALLILGQYHAEIAQANGGRLHDGGAHNAAGGVTLFEEGVDIVVEDGILGWSLVILAVAVRLVADCPDTAGIGIDLGADSLGEGRCVDEGANHLVILHAVGVAGG